MGWGLVCLFGRGCDLLGWGNGGLDGGVWSVERGGKVGWMGGMVCWGEYWIG